MRQECTTWRMGAVSEVARPFVPSRFACGARLSEGSAYGYDCHCSLGFAVVREFP